MGCQSCKEKSNTENLSVYKNENLPRNKESKGVGFTIFEYSVKILIFSIVMLISPIIILFVWYLLFKTIILDKGNVSLMPFLLSVGKKLKIGIPQINYEDDDDYEDLDVNNPDDYVLDEPVDEIRLN